MRKLKLIMECSAEYTSEIEVPDELSLEEAIQYAKDHNEYIDVGDLIWIKDTQLYDECCHFDEEENK